MKKINTPTKNVHKQLFQETVTDSIVGSCDDIEFLPADTTVTDDDIQNKADGCTQDIFDTNMESIPVTVKQEQLEKAVSRPQELLPSVTEHFIDKGRLDEWTHLRKHLGQYLPRN